MPEELKNRIDAVLIGGNHLASALIGWLGANESSFPPYSVPIEQAREVITDPDIYDAWVCWKTIMRLRDYIEDQKPCA